MFRHPGPLVKMTSHFKRLAIAKLREAREIKRAYLGDVLHAFTEQEGWAFAIDPAAERDRHIEAILEYANIHRPKPVKEVKVYRGPGYPIDPERELRRQGPQFLCSPFVWNRP